VLAGLRLIGEDMDKEYIRRAVRWLKSRQHEDGGWGESCDTYRALTAKTGRPAPDRLGAYQVDSAGGTHRRGQESVLLSTQNADGYWDEDDYTGTGFPKVFYLRYHMYCKNFPLWALSMYHSITTRGRTRSEEVRLENRQKGTYRHLVG
jgi:squalene-hopene/tetraprenyl-beta-curcumene cyclase